jgi:SynChlorMet cassette protein ScmD
VITIIKLKIFMKREDKPLADPLLVLREEFDDWAILFDPDSGDSYGLNPVSVFIFKLLDGKNSIQDIVTRLKSECEGVPEDAESIVMEFIEDIVEKGFAGYEFLPQVGVV